MIKDFNENNNLSFYDWQYKTTFISTRKYFDANTQTHTHTMRFFAVFTILLYFVFIATQSTESGPLPKGN